MIQNMNIVLREITELDIENLRILRNKKCFRENFLYSGIISEEQQKIWFEKYNKDKNDVMFVIEDKIINTYIGFVAIYNIDSYDKSAEFGRLMIREEFQGNNISVTAMQLIFKYASDTLNLNSLYLVVKKRNVAAVVNYIKAGFFVEKITSSVYYMNKIL